MRVNFENTDNMKTPAREIRQMMMKEKRPQMTYDSLTRISKLIILNKDVSTDELARALYEQEQFFLPSQGRKRIRRLVEDIQANAQGVQTEINEFFSHERLVEVLNKAHKLFNPEKKLSGPSSPVQSDPNQNQQNTIDDQTQQINDIKPRDQQLISDANRKRLYKHELIIEADKLRESKSTFDNLLFILLASGFRSNDLRISKVQIPDEGDISQNRIRFIGISKVEPSKQQSIYHRRIVLCKTVDFYQLYKRVIGELSKNQNDHNWKSSYWEGLQKAINRNSYWKYMLTFSENCKQGHNIRGIYQQLCLASLPSPPRNLDVFLQDTLNHYSIDSSMHYRKYSEVIDDFQIVDEALQITKQLNEAKHQAQIQMQEKEALRLQTDKEKEALRLENEKLRKMIEELQQGSKPPKPFITQCECGQKFKSEKTLANHKKLRCKMAAN